jgi:ParB-like chromosome segregation protein Spo0J
LLSSIVADKKLWPRQDIDWERVKEFSTLYKEEPEALPKIIVVPHPKQSGKYLLIDGWHRVTAMRQIWKEAQVPAEVKPKGTDVFAEATRLSAVSSKPLTILEKRAAVRRLLDEHGPNTKDKWSDSQIARIAGVSQPFVGSQRKALTRIGGEVKDALKKALAPDTSASATRSAPEAPTINQLLLNVVADERADQITLERWRDIAARYPQIKPVMRHIGTVLFQASQDTAPDTQAHNVMGQGTA